MEDFYPYLKTRFAQVERLVKIEEEKFLKTLTYGEQLLLDYLDTSPTKVEKEMAFKLYDTFGFPLELTKEIAAEKNIQVDEVGFKQEMEAQRQRARSAREVAGSMKRQSADLLAFTQSSLFSYDPTPIQATIIGVFKNGEVVDSIEGEGELIFDKTTFYAESGGQISDSGYLKIYDEMIHVDNVQKAPNKQPLHYIDTKGISLRIGDIVELHVDLEKRRRITRHHSSAHLLQKALKEVVGNHIQQAGSYVDDQKVRFDFTHFEKVSAEQLMKVERRVNEMIDAGYDSSITYMDLDSAKKQGAVALFDEKYEDIVRVVRFGDVSTELCGGCHVTNTSDIGLFVIEFEESISSGVRRIQASVGLAAYHFVKSKEAILQGIATQLGALSVYETNDRLQAQIHHIQEQKILIEQLKEEVAKAYAIQFIQQTSSQRGFPVMIKVVKNMDKEVLLKIVDQIKSSLPSYFLYFINQLEDKLQLLAAASQDLVAKGINCGKLIKETATLAGGGGGGRPEMAQAGGKDVSKVSTIEQHVQHVIENLK